MQTETHTDPRLLLLSPRDNIFIVRGALRAGDNLLVEGQAVTVARSVSMGHKLARCRIEVGEKVLKYGFPIGSASQVIEVGEHVHVNNVVSDYTPTYKLDETSSGQQEISS